MHQTRSIVLDFGRVDADTDTIYSLTTDGTSLWLLTVDSSTAAAFYKCASCASSSSWTTQTSPWPSGLTNLTSVSLSYDSLNSDLYAFAIHDTSEQAYRKLTDATTISWGSETSLAFTAGDLGHISSELTGPPVSATVRQGANFEFANVVAANQNPNAPTSLGPTGLVDGSFGTDNTPTPTFTLSDPDSADTVKFRIQIDDSSDFSSAVVDYTSALAAQGATSFTVGQAAGSGSYTTGSAGQTLSDGSYYWRVLAIDNSAAESAYSTANSGAIAFKIDATAPTSIDLDSPGDNSYTNSERPSFKWKATTDATAGLSKYVLEIDNPSAGSGQVNGDFTIDSIPTSRTTDYETNKYIIRYENFSDSGSTNNYISVYTKSHSDWGSSENDGKLREGKVSWKVKAVDNAGNETSSSRTLFVDRTNPNVEFTQINEIATSSLDKLGTPRNDGVSTTDKTPTIFGKITDTLSGGDSGQSQNDNGPKIASGPKEVNIKVEQKQGLTYKLVTLYKINMDNPYYTCESAKTIDNSKQKCDKYLPFEYTPKENLGLGQYKITLSGKDKADNSSSETTLTLNITTLAQITTPEEKKIIEEETKTLKPEEKKEIQEKLEITKPTEVPKPNALEKAGENISQAGKNVIQGTGNLITTVFTGIGKGIGFTFNTIGHGVAFVFDKTGQGLAFIFNKTGQGLAFIGNGMGTGLNNTGHAIGSGLAFIGQGIGTAFSNTASAIGQGYSSLANNAPGATKNILIAVGNGVTTVGKTIGNGVNTTGNAIGILANNTRQGISNTGNAIANGTSGVVTTTTTIAKNTGLAIASATQKGVDTAKEGVAKTAFFVGEKTQGISDSVAVTFLRVGYSLLTEPTRISDVEAVVLSPTSVKISWHTNHPANGKVNYGFNDGDYPFEAQTDKRTTYREFTLTNLKPDTEYHYEVMSQNKNYVYDANRKFTTPKEE